MDGQTSLDISCRTHPMTPGNGVTGKQRAMANGSHTEGQGPKPQHSARQPPSQRQVSAVMSGFP